MLIIARTLSGEELTRLRSFLYLVRDCDTLCRHPIPIATVFLCGCHFSVERLSGLDDGIHDRDQFADAGNDRLLVRFAVQSEAGKNKYKKRKQTVEPVFGIIKHGMKFRQFLLRGIEKVRGEWSLVSLAYNCRRLHTLVLARG